MSKRDPIKVYDARWEESEFSDDEIRRLFEATFAYGRTLNADTVTIARDARLGGARVMEIARTTALRMGFAVYLCPEPISTPHGYFLTHYISHKHPNTMGLMITASHNPAEYIGVKFTVPVVQAIGLDCGPQGGLARIRELYHSEDKYPDAPGGSLHLLNLTREYVDFSLQQAGIKADTLSGMKVVVDAMNGSSGTELTYALQQAGAEVIPLRIEPDGRFPTGSPNPTSLGKMDDAIKLTGEMKAAAFIGLDGDGDRLVFGDHRGLLSAGFASIPILQACGLGPDVGQTQPVLYDPKVNPVSLAEWSKLKAQPVLFRNGHSQIKDYMRRIDALAAAEESGHYYHRITMDGLTVACENSLLTSLLFLEAVHCRPHEMDELWEMQAQVHTTGEFNYQFDSDQIRDDAMATIVQHFESAGACTTTATPDGIDLQGTVINKGVKLDNGGAELEPEWYSGYLRVATNEPSVARSYFSAGQAEVIQQIESTARNILANQFNGRVID